MSELNIISEKRQLWKHRWNSCHPMSENPIRSDQPEPRLGFLDITVLILSVYVLIALLTQLIFRLPPAVNTLLDRIDVFVCFVFLIDFSIAFRRAPSKREFMKWGWIDLLSSIPVWDALRWGRLIKLARIIRLLRAFRSARNLFRFLFRNPTRAATGTAALSAAVLLILSSIAILMFEDAPSSTITTPMDAIWWAVSTITTVGYGDKVPVTMEGKAVAIVLMLGGVGIFSLISGLLARLLIEPELKHEENELEKLTKEVRSLREAIEQLQHTPHVVDPKRPSTAAAPPIASDIRR